MLSFQDKEAILSLNKMFRTIISDLAAAHVILSNLEQEETVWSFCGHLMADRKLYGLPNSPAFII